VNFPFNIYTNTLSVFPSLFLVFGLLRNILNGILGLFVPVFIMRQVLTFLCVYSLSCLTVFICQQTCLSA